MSRSSLWCVLAWGCVAPGATVLPPTTSGSGTGDTAADPQPPPEAVPLTAEQSVPFWYHLAFSARLGTDLAWWGSELLAGAPSVPGTEGDDHIGDSTELLRRDGTSSTGVFDPTCVVAWNADCQGPYGSHNGFGSAVVTPGDLTGDGVDDLVVGDARDREHVDRWWVVAGPDFEAGDHGFPDLLPPGRAVACGDVDVDGAVDLCSDHGVLFGPVSATSTPELTWDGPERALVAGDLGDGGTSLLLADGSAVLRVADFPRSGPVALASLAASSWTTGAALVRQLALGDLDADGVVDLVVGLDDGTVRVGRPPDGGDLVALARTTLPVSAWDLAVADFDGDGLLDLAVGGDGIVSVWRGPLPPGQPSLADADAVWCGLEYGADDFGRALAAADTDGDGRAELAIGAPLDGPFQDEDHYLRYGEHGRVWWLDAAGL